MNSCVVIFHTADFTCFSPFLVAMAAYKDFFPDKHDLVTVFPSQSLMNISLLLIFFVGVSTP